MEMSPSIAALAAALAKAQSAIKGAVKESVNPAFVRPGSGPRAGKYADLAAVWEACRAALSANGLAVIQVTEAVAQTVTIKTMLAHSSGEWVSGSLAMTAQQNTPQAIGSCITYARRYSLAAMVGVAPEDDDGNEANSTTPGQARRMAPKEAARSTGTSGAKEALDQSAEAQEVEEKMGAVALVAALGGGSPWERIVAVADGTPFAGLAKLKAIVKEATGKTNAKELNAADVDKVQAAIVMATSAEVPL